MSELEKFKCLVTKDPFPGQKNRVKRVENLYLIPGWVFNSKDDLIEVKYKKANKIFSELGYSSQIVYDVLILGLTDIKDRPRCPICNKELKFEKFSEGYLKSCGADSCKKECIKMKVMNLWKNRDYRLQQSKSHKDWAMIEENREFLKQRTIKTWQNEEYREHQINIHKEFAKNNPDKINNGIYGVISCLKSDTGILKYDSSWEKLFIEACEECDNIVSINRPNFHIQYFYEGSEYSYFPDFIIKLKNNIELVIEIKANWKIRTDKRTVEKLKTGKDYINNNSIFKDFLVITEDILFSDKNCKYYNSDFLDKLLADYLLIN